MFSFQRSYFACKLSLAVSLINLKQLLMRSVDAHLAVHRFCLLQEKTYRNLELCVKLSYCYSTSRRKPCENLTVPPGSAAGTCLHTNTLLCVCTVNPEFWEFILKICLLCNKSRRKSSLILCSPRKVFCLPQGPSRCITLILLALLQSYVCLLETGF